LLWQFTLQARLFKLFFIGDFPVNSNHFTLCVHAINDSMQLACRLTLNKLLDLEIFTLVWTFRVLTILDLNKSVSLFLLLGSSTVLMVSLKCFCFKNGHVFKNQLVIHNLVFADSYFSFCRFLSFWSVLSIVEVILIEHVKRWGLKDVLLDLKVLISHLYAEAHIGTSIWLTGYKYVAAHNFTEVSRCW
jgi:hypothetical protein